MCNYLGEDDGEYYGADLHIEYMEAYLHYCEEYGADFFGEEYYACEPEKVEFVETALELAELMQYAEGCHEDPDACPNLDMDEFE